MVCALMWASEIVLPNIDLRKQKIALDGIKEVCRRSAEFWPKLEGSI